MKADNKELRRNLLVLSMAAAMLFQFVPDNISTQAAASSRREGSRKAGDTTAELDGTFPVQTEEAENGLSGSVTLTEAPESGLGALVFTAAEESAEEDGTTAEETEEEADPAPAEEASAPVESADVLTEEAAADTTEEVAADTTEEAAADTTEETAADTTEEAAADTTEEAAADTTEEAAADTTEEAAADTTEEAAADTAEETAADTAEAAAVTVDPNTATKNSSWTGQVLNSYVGAVYGPSGGKEVYYNMNMSQVVANLKSAGYEGDYWVRDDGVKMFGNYVMVAACYSVHPYGSFVETTLGTAIVCDTGTFAYSYPQMLDVAVTW